MSRILALAIFVAALTSFGAHGAGHLMCEQLDDFMKNVSMDENLTSQQKDHLTGELHKADAMCKEGKTEEAEKILRQADNEWASSYFGDLMSSGH